MKIYIFRIGVVISTALVICLMSQFTPGTFAASIGEVEDSDILDKARPLFLDEAGDATSEMQPLKIPRGKAKFREGEIIVKFKNEKFKVLPAQAFGGVEGAIEHYRGLPNVEYAEPNYHVYLLSQPNDPFYYLQWHLDNGIYGGINLEKARDITQGAGVTVAVIDSGVAFEDYGEFRKATDLMQTTFVPGFNVIDQNSHANDDVFHGTHVAGTIAQSTDNSLGVAGVAPQASLMPVKVYSNDDGSSVAWTAEGIYWATDHGADVINMSLGVTATSTTLEEAVAYAYNNGVTIVASTGNDGDTTLYYPAAYDQYVIAVGATRYNENSASYSNRGPHVDLVAPGGDGNDNNNDGFKDQVLQQTLGATNADFTYYLSSGTSMAAPHVSGVAALVIASGKATTPDAVRQVLENSADDLGALGRDNQFGWGLVNAACAVTPAGYPCAEAGSDKTVSIGQSSSYSGVKSKGFGSTLTYQWSMGDGTNLNGATVSYAYPAAGSYTVTLTVTNSQGQSDSDTLKVTVNDPAVPPATPFEDKLANLNSWAPSGIAWKSSTAKENVIPSPLYEIWGYKNYLARSSACGSGCTMTLNNPLNLSVYTTATLSFMRYMDNELDAGEHLLVEVFDGVQWVTVADLTGGAGAPGTDTWLQENIDVTSYLNGQFKMRFIANQNLDSEDIQIDDIVITGSSDDSGNSPQISLRDTYTSTTNSISRSTNPITPTADSLLVVVASSASSISGPPLTFSSFSDTCTGTGPWSSITEHQATGYEGAIAIGWAQLGASPGTCSVTVTGSQSSNRWVLHTFEVIGHDVITPVAQTKTGKSSSGQTLTLTFGNTPAMESLIIGGISIREHNGETVSISPTTGYTELAEGSISGSTANQNNQEVQDKSGNAGQDISWTWTGGENNNIAVAIEIRP